MSCKQRPIISTIRCGEKFCGPCFWRGSEAEDSSVHCVLFQRWDCRRKGRSILRSKRCLQSEAHLKAVRR